MLILKIFKSKSIELVSILQPYAKTGEAVDIQKLFMKYTLDSFGIIGFDIHFDTLQSKENETGI